MSKRFESLGVREELTRVLKTMGVTEPTPVQAQAIPALLAGRDVIAQAQTGTGKTLAFVLPILERIDPKKRDIQALIITPTRELALQISTEVDKLAGTVGAKALAAYGGQDVERQLKKLQGDIHVVIGTPGRLLDHLRRESLHFGRLDFLVLDEADQMLQLGFLAEVEEIIAQTSSKRQTLLFSATMPDAVRSLARRYMKEPDEIRIEPKRITLEEIEQVVVETSDRGKQEALVKAIEDYRPYLAMVFCRTKRRASTLNEALQERGLASDELHGDLSQAKREQVMKRFRDGKVHILVATDVAARGIDVEGITHVFNYDIPHDVESYIHRIGRTGRAGQRGMAVTFASPHDRFFVEMIERGIRKTISKKSARKGLSEGESEVRGGRGRNSEGESEARGVRRSRSEGGNRGAGSARRGTGESKSSGGSSGARRGTGESKSSGGAGSARRGTGESKSWGGASGVRRGTGESKSSGGAGSARRGTGETRGARKRSDGEAEPRGVRRSRNEGDSGSVRPGDKVTGDGRGSFNRGSETRVAERGRGAEASKDWRGGRNSQASAERRGPRGGDASAERRGPRGGDASAERRGPRGGDAGAERRGPRGGDASAERRGPRGGDASAERRGPRGGDASAERRGPRGGARPSGGGRWEGRAERDAAPPRGPRGADSRAAGPGPRRSADTPRGAKPARGPAPRGPARRR